MRTKKGRHSAHEQVCAVSWDAVLECPAWPILALFGKIGPGKHGNAITAYRYFVHMIAPHPDASKIGLHRFLMEYPPNDLRFYLHIKIWSGR